ncbi:superoxide dismutase family protein [Frigidibacter albus]|uniref:Superoxide dismutase family protein n=1 Tax=Frigidibacter albus TaxID=1465486 RepID=A0A6L8VIV1_9RHOB|nr:superoxide dismutase family protein [Frigidibacter albus]MZQ89100.1 superoxide dismutase family protein [Frigidibacter albus]NBE30843.1 superoxide dismutase family protein [Frigidibacter albus]GGH51441.1 superoxide dismutase [Cu-Zn] [Frigidibacter albus]
MFRTAIPAALLAASFAFPAAAQQAPAQETPTAPAPEVPAAAASFVDAEGAEIGTATLTGTPHGVLIGMEVTGLPASKWVAFHIHEGETCEHDHRFESAGGHFNPSEADHGYMSETGPHSGDMPNQYVASDGILMAEVFNSYVDLDGGPTSVIGRTLMIHAEPDDYTSQPAGAAGERLACAVIEAAS